jgi:hypothetical protein
MPVRPKRSIAEQARQKPLFFWIVLLIGVVELGLYVFDAGIIARYGALTRDNGWTAAQRDGKWVIDDVNPQGPAAGKVQRGDVLLAITDDHPRLPKDGKITSRQHVYAMKVLRGGEHRRLELQSEIRRTPGRLPSMLGDLAASLGFCLAGLVLGIAKPQDRLTRRASLTLLVFASYEIGSSLFSVLTLLTFWECAVFYLTLLGNPLQFALAYSFYYRFPQSAPRGRIWTALEYLLYLWGGLVCLVYAWVYFSVFQDGPLAPGFKWRLHATPVILTASLAMCAVIIRNYRSVREPDQRRRIQWVIYGSIVGIAPNLLNTAALSVSRLRFIEDQSSTASSALGAVTRLMAMAVPLSIGYAVLKHRAFDVNVVIRRGLQHLFAKQGLQVILALPIAGLLYTIIVNRNLPLTAILTGNPLLLVLIAAAGLSLKFRRQVIQWIDRRFFREAYSQEQILLNLIDKIKALDSMQELSRLVSKEVESALHPEHVYVFYRGDERRDLTLGYSSGGKSAELRIAEDSGLLQWMRRQRGAQELSPSSENTLPEESRAWLAQLEVNLIVPMGGEDGRLTGLLLLGEKKSEEPYTKNDRQLLEAIASQMAVVYENVWLKEQAVKEQKIKHEVLARFEERQINLVKECPACGACYDSASTVCDKDGRELNLSLPVERTIEGKYRLDQMIGRGGMGAVYQATDLRLNRKVAIKIMLGSMFGDRTALRRFEREAQASARLDHPNIISVHDFGSIRAEGAYLVMELVQGPTLRSELKRRGQFDCQTAAAYFTQILAGVNAAHQAGVIHRDLKPENVLIARQAGSPDQIKLLDFGLARINQLDPSNPQSLTVPGTILGTLAYMSPEQVMGEEVDERGDIFSLGVMVVEALTGARPFVGRTSAELMASIVGSPFRLAGEVGEIEQLDCVLQKCLAKDRAQRFVSVAAMRQELIPAMERCPPFPAAPVSSKEMRSRNDATETFLMP